MSTVIEDFPAMKEAVAAMRALLEGASEDLVFESMLVARELITNALRYGGGRAYFTYDVEKGYLRIAVRSENGFRPPAEVPREREGTLPRRLPLRKERLRRKARNTRLHPHSQIDMKKPTQV